MALALKGREKSSEIREKLYRATKEIVRVYVGLPELHFLDTCIDCGVCAASCPWSAAISEFLYGPHAKAGKLRMMYRRTNTISGKILGPIVRAHVPDTEEELERIYDAAYHCSNCGWCFYTCPHGVDSGALVALLRSVLYRVGKVPRFLGALAKLEKEILLEDKMPLEASAIWEERLAEIRERHEALPLGEAPNLILLTLYDVTVGWESINAYFTLLDAAGIKYSVPDKPLGVKPPMPFVIGDLEGAKQVAESVYAYAVSKGAKSIVVLDGGYSYNDLRYFYTFYRATKPKGLEVTHVLKLLYETYDATGLPPLVRWGRAAYIPSGHIDTRGGIGDGAKLVEATTEKYDKYLLWPYAGVGNVSLTSRKVIEQLGPIVGITLNDLDGMEKRLIEHIKLVADELVRQSVRTSPGYHIYSSMDDIIVLQESEEPGLKPMHIAVWLAKHLK